MAAALRERVAASGLTAAIRFMPPMPMRDALTLGRLVVLPSRAESLPYVVLEAAAAGRPLITTRVGGIPEIYGPLADGLVIAGDVGHCSRRSPRRSATWKRRQPPRRRCASA